MFWYSEKGIAVRPHSKMCGCFRLHPFPTALLLFISVLCRLNKIIFGKNKHFKRLTDCAYSCDVYIVVMSSKSRKAIHTCRGRDVREAYVNFVILNTSSFLHGQLIFVEKMFSSNWLDMMMYRNTAYIDILLCF